jgi:16S rRNA (adenine1518-N6/adenine1519-N6)-dimethyltransferase
MGFFDSPSELRNFLLDRGLALKKRFGQNFLVDPNVRRRILEVLDLHPGERVWEIGPGLGAMTDLILNSGVELRCFEIDHGFVRVLKERYGDLPGFSIVPGDAVKTWKAFRSEAPSKVFGNLPYASGATLIGEFLEHRFVPGCWIFMVQREVARRMVAPPGSAEYSSFSVLCQTFSKIQILFDVSPEAFYPRPRVVSTLLRMGPPVEPLPIEEGIGQELFLGVVRSAFASRRKKLQNTLDPLLRSLGVPEKELFIRAGIDPARRAETLSPKEFLQLGLSMQELQVEQSLLHLPLP